MFNWDQEFFRDVANVLHIRRAKQLPNGQWSVPYSPPSDEFKPKTNKTSTGKLIDLRSKSPLYTKDSKASDNWDPNFLEDEGYDRELDFTPPNAKAYEEQIYNFKLLRVLLKGTVGQVSHLVLNNFKIAITNEDCKYIEQLKSSESSKHQQDTEVIQTQIKAVKENYEASKKNNLQALIENEEYVNFLKEKEQYIQDFNKKRDELEQKIEFSQGKNDFEKVANLESQKSILIQNAESQLDVYQKQYDEFVRPLKELEQHLNEELSRICLEHSKKEQQFIQKIQDIEQNWIKYILINCREQLLNLVMNNSQSITHLNMSDFGISNYGDKPFIEKMPKDAWGSFLANFKDKLQYLDVRNNNLTTEIAENLMKKSSEFTQLKFLNLANNQLGDNGVLEVAKNLPKNLTHLDMSFNNTTVNGLVEVLKCIAHKEHNLEYINFSCELLSNEELAEIKPYVTSLQQKKCNVFINDISFGVQHFDVAIHRAINQFSSLSIADKNDFIQLLEEPPSPINPAFKRTQSARGALNLLNTRDKADVSSKARSMNDRDKRAK